MDYVVGSVAALISGNVTPNRPRLVKRALTPTKHQPSPNVTPKSELGTDRSIFLSPTLQKKKAIVKKSPKRIFQNPDLDVTNDGEGNSSLTSPKAEKVKKHLKEELDAEEKANNSAEGVKSPKGKHNKSIDTDMTKKKNKNCDPGNSTAETIQANNESTPKKKKKQKNSISESSEVTKCDDKENFVSEEIENVESVVNILTPGKSPRKKKNKKSKSNSVESVVSESKEEESVENTEKPSKSKKRKSVSSDTDNFNVETINQSNDKSPNKKRKTSESTENENQLANKQSKNKKKRKKKLKSQNTNTQISVQKNSVKIDDKQKKNKNAVNPNAITNEDTDSEHESDDDVQSETEEANNEILNAAPAEDSSDEEEEKKPDKTEKHDKEHEVSEEEVKRTLFVGNVPFSQKCKKEIKKIFSKYGHIETVRIRTVPVKDARITPKLAVIKNELHPERTTVNVYVKFTDSASVEKALVENNTVLNDHHLRVSRSESTGAAHDPRSSVFVGNLPFALEDDVLREKFQKCGEIDSVRIIRDKKTNAGKGFGYVNFVSKDAVELALALPEEDLTIKNRIIRVKRCTQNQKPKTQKPNNQKQGNKNWSNRPIQSNQGFKGRQGFQRQGGQDGGFQGRQGRFQKQGTRQNEDGAYRRIMKKREHQGNSDGPPNKKSKDQPEKKARKEFVGMTAEKKKKRKFNKGMKKKKVISEILSK